MESLKGIVTMHQRWKVLSTVPLRLSTMPLRVQDTKNRFQHSVWNSWSIRWNGVIERERLKTTMIIKLKDI